MPALTIQETQAQLPDPPHRQARDRPVEERVISCWFAAPPEAGRGKTRDESKKRFSKA